MPDITARSEECASPQHQLAGERAVVLDGGCRERMNE
jgi:hypothetical protein